MNRRRVAALLRELADEVERGEAAPEKKKPTRRRGRVLAVPADVTELDRERARATARRLGLVRAK